MNKAIIPDAAIIKFLLEKGVQVTPPGISNRFLEAAVTGISASEGITAQASAHSAQQLTKNARQDEWRSWKQWALSQPDWPEWYDGYQLDVKEVEEATERERIQKLQAEAEAAGFTDIQTYKLHKLKKEEAQNKENLFILAFVVGVASTTILILSNISPKKIQPASPQTNAEESQSSSISPKVAACLNALKAANYDTFMDGQLRYQQDKANCWSSD